ncbi:hypothetical protein CcaverHIS002_0606000 [Cutaneotrichosporon cavernicola]|uniref:Uncharacterized protein n=1 Tax=Cutaneotrichosporon cavernicola TaxID=279322 RepID=A0AA48L8X4_9TREE|nr:uncharacterized protein CcaverHIS019_0605460 [Cutaneotrichosporon cavernicola]BEI86313.1 hypothetical protein CcaverHIS002_0606000 [Cutaneotrichosporon cavernicola]BEI94087.1 hypothetical protein CcaverHIS019_0605460 [Cutaneotrichosporon cavernicola]BEJ01866.1 hypothetical protein CcaverHIS631_0605480 [Cutaneotrichosporon cavernicola]BEJ09631.1 hypothetical protein CcaverHIS641_0605460 [Cutaneotrichosporon cavernicola]
MLTIGHSHWRFNFGLFWQIWDQSMGSYRKCDTTAQDYEYWQQWASSVHAVKDDAETLKAKRWLSKSQSSEASRPKKVV